MTMSRFCCYFTFYLCPFFLFFFSSRRRHTIFSRDWSSDVCSSDLLSGIREPDERRVGEQLQPQVEREHFAGKARLCETRRLPRRRGEALVAAARRAAARDDDARAGMCEVGEKLLVLVEHLRSDGHVQLHVLAGRAVLQRASPVPAPAGLEPLVRMEARQVAEIRVGSEHNVATWTADATDRTAFGDVLLATEREAAVAAPPRLHVDAGAVVEHGTTP